MLVIDNWPLFLETLKDTDVWPIRNSQAFLKHSTNDNFEDVVPASHEQ
jgi:hypothetical protein